MSVERRGKGIACSLTPRGSSLKAGSVIGVSLIVLRAAVAAGMQVPAGGNPAPERYPVVPSPVSIVASPGEFRLDSATRIFLSDTANADLRSLADMLAAPLRAASAGALALPVSLAREHAGASNSITIELVPSRTSADSESYHLVVTPRGVTLSAPGPVGLLHGLETIRQLLPPELERAAPARWVIPSVTIDDAPRFPYRGRPPRRGTLVLSTRVHRKGDRPPRALQAQHPSPASDRRSRLAVGDQEVSAPHRGRRLAEGDHPRPELPPIHRRRQAARRVLHPATDARDRRIRRGASHHHHSGDRDAGAREAALAAYPELSCTGGPFQVSTRWGVHEDIYCPSERTFGFLEDVLTEVMRALSEPLHPHRRRRSPEEAVEGEPRSPRR